MPNYKLGKIYLLKSKNTDLCYVGSTCSYLSRRFSQHIYDNKQSNKNISSSIIIGYGDAYIELYKLCPCDNREELLRTEQLVINELNCVNKHNSKLTKEEKQQVRKAYLEKNKEHTKEVRKAYLEKNKEHTKEVKKAYYEKTREHKLKYKKEWRDKQVQTICECGGTYTYGRQKRHKESKRHQLFIQ